MSTTVQQHLSPAVKCHDQNAPRRDQVMRARKHVQQQSHHGLYAHNAELCMLLPTAEGTMWTCTDKDAGSKLSVYTGITNF